MTRFAAIALVLLAGCGEREGDRSSPTAAPAPAVRDEVVESLPFLVRYRAPEWGGPTMFREAIVGGVLDLAGPCVRVQDSEGRSRLLVTSNDMAVKRDSNGLYLIGRNQERLGHGASIQGGGGALPGLPEAALLQDPPPPACAEGPALELVGMIRPDSADVATLPVLPPAPPTGR